MTYIQRWHSWSLSNSGLTGIRFNNSLFVLEIHRGALGFPCQSLTELRLPVDCYGRLFLCHKSYVILTCSSKIEQIHLRYFNGHHRVNTTPLPVIRYLKLASRGERAQCLT